MIQRRSLGIGPGADALQREHRRRGDRRGGGVARAGADQGGAVVLGQRRGLGRRRADDRGGELLRVDIARRHRPLDVPPAAQHGDGVGDLQHFADLVQDQDDGDAAPAQPVKAAEQRRDAGGCQHRGGFVEDQHARVGHQRARDLHRLLAFHRQVAHAVAQPRGHAETVQMRPPARLQPRRG